MASRMRYNNFVRFELNENEMKTLMNFIRPIQETRLGERGLLTFLDFFNPETDDGFYDVPGSGE